VFILTFTFLFFLWGNRIYNNKKKKAALHEMYEFLLDQKENLETNMSTMSKAIKLNSEMMSPLPDF